MDKSRMSPKTRARLEAKAVDIARDIAARKPSAAAHMREKHRQSIASGILPSFQRQNAATGILRRQKRQSAIYSAAQHWTV